MKLKVLDLFSGIGGFALALRPISHTVAYCEQDVVCHKVLLDQMRKGALDTAHVFDDVRNLDLHRVRSLNPTMITAGFPCQDISCLHNGLGIDGPRSRLFFEIPKIAMAVPSIQHVFLENSPCIVKRGLEKVIAALKKAGFVHVAYSYFSAAEVGALHVRRRWLCIASKNPVSLPLFTVKELESSTRFNWVHEPVPRVISRSSDMGVYNLVLTRAGMLGNSVVPQAAVLAYQTLVVALLQRNHVTTKMHQLSKVVVVIHKSSLPIVVLKPNLPIVVVPNFVKIAMVGHNGEQTMRSRWSTPTHRRSTWAQYKTTTLTRRGSEMLINQVMFASDTHCPRQPKQSPKSHMSYHCTINPEFIEHLMGFPVGWTNAAMRVPPTNE